MNMPQILRRFSIKPFRRKYHTLSWSIVASGNFIKKESLAQVFSCEFCEFSKNTYFYRTPPVAALFHEKKLPVLYEKEWQVIFLKVSKLTW